MPRRPFLPRMVRPIVPMCVLVVVEVDTLLTCQMLPL
jgi:hypothetical protein